MKFMTLTQIWKEIGYEVPYCPIDDTTCPYYHQDTGRCIMDVETDLTPYDECDAFYDVAIEDIKS